MSSEFAICHVVRHGNVNSIQNPSTVTNSTINNGALLYSSATYVAVPYNVTNRKLLNVTYTGSCPNLVTADHMLLSRWMTDGYLNHVIFDSQQLLYDL